MIRKWGTTMESGTEFTQKLKSNRTSIFNTNFGYIFKRTNSRVLKTCLNTRFHSRIIHNSLDIKATQQMNENTKFGISDIRIYLRILFSFKKERNPTT